jgi:hypothetical protein
MANLREVVDLALMQGRLAFAQAGGKRVRAGGGEVIKDVQAEMIKVNELLTTVPKLIEAAAAKGQDCCKVMDLKFGEHHNEDKIGVNHMLTAEKCKFYVSRAIAEMDKAGLKPDICRTAGSDVWELHITFPTAPKQ